METAEIEAKPVIRNLEERDFSILSDETEPWGFQKEGRGFLEWFMKFRPDHRLSLVVVVDGKIVGFYVNIPSLLKVGGKNLTVFRGSLGVHPEFRRKRYNVFTLLVRAMHEETRKRGGMIYGFPRMKLISYFTRKIKFRSLKTVPRYVRGMSRFSLTGLLPRKLRLRFCEQVRVGRVGSFGEEFSRLWEAASRADKIMIVRNPEYLNWWFCGVPGEKNVIFAGQDEGGIAGYVVVRIAEREGIRSGEVVDLFDVRRPYVTKNLLMKALEYFHKQGAAQAECHISDDYYEKALRSLGFVRKDELGRGTLLIVKSYSSEIDGDYFHDPQNWFITKADMLFS